MQRVQAANPQVNHKPQVVQDMWPNIVTATRLRYSSSKKPRKSFWDITSSWSSTLYLMFRLQIHLNHPGSEEKQTEASGVVYHNPPALPTTGVAQGIHPLSWLIQTSYVIEHIIQLLPSPGARTHTWIHVSIGFTFWLKR